MGIFKKRKEAPPKVSQDEILQNLADFNEKQGNWQMAFKLRHKAVIDLYDGEIVKFLVRAREDKSNAYQFLCLARDQYDSFRDWCMTQPDGERFFDYFDRTGSEKVSRYERILSDIAKLEK